VQGRADQLPGLARQFFDQFNWQGFDSRDRVNTFSRLLQRVYDFTRDPAHRYPGGAVVAPITGTPEDYIESYEKDRYELVVVRPNIEHNMLGIIMGRGGLDELGATFWGQTELSCYDDSMHGAP
jgi:hypothetical protein